MSEWRREFLLAAEAVDAGIDVRRAAARGELVRVVRGIYIPTERWEQLDAADQHRARAYAHEIRAPGRHVFSRVTAAALWRLPRIGPWPGHVHVDVRHATGGRSEGGIRRHTVGNLDIERFDGVMLTSLLRTAVDSARFESFLNGVVIMDAALGGIDVAGQHLAVTADEAMAVIAGLKRERGTARARSVLAFADARSGSPGESVSRVNMHVAGIPAPQLQYAVRDRAGVMYADFCWPERKVIGEFDGRAKYLREEFTGGRSTADVVLAEKAREDRLRRLGWTVVRWDWDIALSPHRLAARLRPVTSAG